MFWVSIPLKVGIFAGMAGIYHMCEPHPGDPGPTSLSSWKKPVVWCKRKAVLLSYLLNLLGIIIVQSPDPHPFSYYHTTNILGRVSTRFWRCLLESPTCFWWTFTEPPHLYNGWSGVHFFPVDFPSAQARNRPGLFLGFPAMFWCWKPWNPPRENHPMIHWGWISFCMALEPGGWSRSGKGILAKPSPGSLTQSHVNRLTRVYGCLWGILVMLMGLKPNL